jgi:hypothetical protein
MPTQLVVPAGQDPVGGPDRRFGVGGGVAAHVGKPLGRGVGSRPPHVYRFGSLMNARNRFPSALVADAQALVLGEFVEGQPVGAFLERLTATARRRTRKKPHTVKIPRPLWVRGDLRCEAGIASAHEPYDDAGRLRHLSGVGARQGYAW